MERREELIKFPGVALSLGTNRESRANEGGRSPGSRFARVVETLFREPGGGESLDPHRLVISKQSSDKAWAIHWGPHRLWFGKYRYSRAVSL